MDKAILATLIFIIPLVQMVVYVFDFTDHFISGEASLRRPGMTSFAALILEWILLCVFGIISGKWYLLIETGAFPALTAATMIRIILYEVERDSYDIYDEFEDHEPSYVIAVPDSGNPGSYIIMKDNHERKQ